ncbi:LOW QUALITY PROTEIN: PDZ and LIM domain protein 7 [Melozone crissalis]|uniref:LOW QUALITY PROTEIN: PDZ and LIM domain protein 7 n=1 Tax=Melozone crissalis TaxID=40204 RepID=UPI0023DB1859|nr:LOW QUALITY PROTEIN: PDZ and LIM domain protein 7 [Melozone crissalis]
MGDMESYKVMLNGPAPWGFRLQGGKDFSMPLSISRLTLGGKAAQAGVGVGDWVLYIDGESTSAMTHIEAQNRIRACGDRLCLTLSRAQNQLGKPQKDSLPCSEPLKYNFAPSTALNKTARPFGAAPPAAGAPQQPPQPLQPPSTPGCDPGKLRMLEDAEDWQPRTGTSQSRSFRKLAQLTGTGGMEDGEDEFIKKPRDSHGSIWGIVEQREPLEPPSTPGCDPGKLRLMEDAEGWQPRTGTSQSRSFRRLAQLTGTDEMEDGEDEIVKKPRDARGSSWGTVEQRQPPQPLEPPSTPGCNPGKLRLMEDAEDWQPRTGTSQSRSFRKLAQLTGTDESESPQGLALPGAAGLSLGCQGLAESGVALERWFWPCVVPVGWLSQGSWWGCVWSWWCHRSGVLVCPVTGQGFVLGQGLVGGEICFLLFPLSPLIVPGPLSVRTDYFLLSLLLRSVEDHDDVFVRKPSQVSVPDPSPGATMKTEPGLAPRTPSATPSPTSRPPWAVDPSFAERYAPDKTSTVVSKHSQPATPTPMQNRSSIVQAAQQAPEGPGRTPLCYKCNKVIRGRYLVALGHYYHPEEFVCCQCRKVLDEGGFFEEKGSIFCPKCYDTRYAPTCAKCKKKITGEVMHALKMTWHVQCFTCNACKTPIRNRAFYMEEGQPYCERDYEKMFGTKCRGCDFKIDAGDRFLEALGFSWHDTCFVCAICQTNLEGKTFYSKKDKPLCKSHAFSHV